MKVDFLNGIDPENIGRMFDEGLKQATAALQAMSPEDKQKIAPLISKVNQMSSAIKSDGFEAPNLEELSKTLMKECEDLKDE